jgi:hypothetical protein
MRRKETLATASTAIRDALVSQCRANSSACLRLLRASKSARRAHSLRSPSGARHDTSRDATRTRALIWPNVVETTTPVDLLGRYSNPDILSRIRQVLAGQGRDRPSHRPVPSVRQKQTRLTDSQRSELLTRYLAGESATALAGEFGINRATAFSLLQRAGVHSRYRILNDDDIAVARQMYDTGQSLAAIGEHFGVADRTVLNVFRRAGVPTRGPGTNQWSPRPSL